jgi:hypothetical protein
MKSSTRSYHILIGVLSVSLAGSSSLAQSAGVQQDRHNFEARAELEAQAKRAEAKGDKAQAYVVHYRLDHGDFHEGDRIVVKVQGSGGFSDTLMVRSGNRLQLPQMGDFSLDGVLRSEITPAITTYVAKYLRNPVVLANPLVRLGILGSVARPGFYYAPADIPLSDLLMTAGGPTPDADVTKVSVRREGQVILDDANGRTALQEGMSLDMLNLQAGDEISVGSHRNFNWQVILPTVTGILGLLLAYSQLHR